MLLICGVNCQYRSSILPFYVNLALGDWLALSNTITWYIILDWQVVTKLMEQQISCISKILNAHEYVSIKCSIRISYQIKYEIPQHNTLKIYFGVELIGWNHSHQSQEDESCNYLLSSSHIEVLQRRILANRLNDQKLIKERWHHLVPASDKEKILSGTRSWNAMVVW